MNRLLCQFYSGNSELNTSYDNGFSGCKNYNSNCNPGFIFTSYAKGEKIVFETSDKNRIFFISSGQLSINLTDKDPNIFDAGHLILRIKDKESIEFVATKETSLVTMQFDNLITICEQMSLENITNDIPVENIEMETLEMNESLNLFILSIINYLNTGVSCKHLYKIKEKEFFLLLHLTYDRKKIARFLSSVLNSQNNFITQVLSNFTIDCNVTELANRCNVSTKTLTRKFKVHFNDTPYQWIIQQKNKFILEKLTQPYVNVKNLSQEIGFATSSHFVNYCKRYLKKTPRSINKELNIKQI